jgi:hypothetical protein
MTSRSVRLCFGMTVAIVCGVAQSAKPSLDKGVIHITSRSGDRGEIQIGKRCSDLWVAPDESVIAFIGIERVIPGTEDDASPAISESSVYVAREVDDFRPIRLPFEQVEVQGRPWRVFRGPSVSPDGKTAYFSVPVTMKDRTLMSVSLPTGVPRVLHDHVEYCVIWGGPKSGALLTLENVYEPRFDGLRCYATSVAGRRTRLNDDGDCSAFLDFASRWARQHKGSCNPPWFGVDSQPASTNRTNGVGR